MDEEKTMPGFVKAIQIKIIIDAMLERANERKANKQASFPARDTPELEKVSRIASDLYEELLRDHASND